MPANNSTVKNLQVIFENNGSTTIQCDEYANRYTDANDAWDDFSCLLDGADPIREDWYVNDGSVRLFPTDRDIQNGKYKVFYADEVAGITDLGEADGLGWNNVATFFQAAGCTIS